MIRICVTVLIIAFMLCGCNSISSKFTKQIEKPTTISASMVVNSSTANIEMPIQDIDKVDIMGIHKDGKGVDLVIVSSNHLDSSPSIQKLLLDKIENYLGYVNSLEFKQEIGNFDSKNIVIKLMCIDEPDPIMKELFMKIGPWVEKSGARFVVELMKHE